MTHRRLFLNNEGFTLVEVMVALVILAGGLLSVLFVRNETFKGASAAEGLFTAVRLSQQRLSDFEILGFPTKSTSGDFPEHPGYKWSVQVVDFTFGPLANLTQVDLAVSYPTLEKEDRVLTISTAYAKK